MQTPAPSKANLDRPAAFRWIATESSPPRSATSRNTACLSCRCANSAAELGVEGMSLYRYVPGREALLDGIVESIIDEMYLDEDVLHKPEHGWQDFLQRFAHGVRRIALSHPRAFPLVASRPPEAPWLRPPLRSLRWVEAFLDGLTSEGFSDEAAVAAYRGFTSFLLGHLLLEVSIWVRTSDRSMSWTRKPPSTHKGPLEIPARESHEQATRPGPFRRRVRRVAREPARSTDPVAQQLTIQRTECLPDSENNEDGPGNWTEDA